MVSLCLPSSVRIGCLLLLVMEDLQKLLLHDHGLSVSTLPEKGRCLFTTREYSPGISRFLNLHPSVVASKWVNRGLDNRSKCVPLKTDTIKRYYETGLCGLDVDHSIYILKLQEKLYYLKNLMFLYQTKLQ